MAAAENNLRVSRQEISKLNVASEANQIEFIDQASQSKEGDWPVEDVTDTKKAVRERAQTTRDFLSTIGDTEQDLRILRGEIWAGGW
jgi:hypothetical protein